MKFDISIIILSAGKGTRMNSSKAKVLHEISGKPMLYYSIYEAMKLSCDIHVVLYHQANDIKKTMHKYFDKTSINYHIQDHENYPGTGGAVMGINTKYKQTLVLNGDMPLIKAEELKSLTIKNKEVINISYMTLKDASGYGRVVIKNDKVEKIVEQKDCSTKELDINKANAGVYCFQTEFLKYSLKKLNNNNAQQEYYITDLVAIAINENNTVKATKVSEQNFKGVNSKYDLSQALDIHQNNIKKNFMLQGVTMYLPQTIYIENGVQIDAETILENGVSLLGDSKIINSHIKSNSQIDNSVIKNSTIGPMARVRPNCDIQQSNIGNFVEVKNSQLNKVKAGHLSYIGDSFVDTGTNIGAGTITCNYDGINKHKTTIGKNVFIGSGCQIIAPIKIEDNCIVGAGSQITKDIKDGELVLNRAETKTIKKYFYKYFKIVSKKDKDAK